MSKEFARTSESGARCLRVMKALRGLSNSDIAKALNIPPSAVTRCMNTLIAEGFATKLDTGRFALSTSTLQIAQAHADEMARATNRIHELNQRVAAGSHY